MSDLPLHGVTETLLPEDPPDAVAELEELRALRDAPVHDDVERGRRLRRLAAAHPTCLDAWAALAAWALEAHDPVAGYAFARTGYHRGLDRARKSGWKGQGPVPWHHEPNRGFLRSVFGLMRAADAIGEQDEARRCRDFLLELDPADHLEVRDLPL